MAEVDVSAHSDITIEVKKNLSFGTLILEVKDPDAPQGGTIVDMDLRAVHQLVVVMMAEAWDMVKEEHKDVIEFAKNMGWMED